MEGWFCCLISCFSEVTASPQLNGEQNKTFRCLRHPERNEKTNEYDALGVSRTGRQVHQRREELRNWVLDLLGKASEGTARENLGSTSLGERSPYDCFGYEEDIRRASATDYLTGQSTNRMVNESQWSLRKGLSGDLTESKPFIVVRCETAPAGIEGARAGGWLVKVLSTG